MLIFLFLQKQSGRSLDLPDCVLQDLVEEVNGPRLPGILENLLIKVESSESLEIKL